jgi:hypothetical protein
MKRPVADKQARDALMREHLIGMTTAAMTIANPRPSIGGRSDGIWPEEVSVHCMISA